MSFSKRLLCLIIFGYFVNYTFLLVTIWNEITAAITAIWNLIEFARR